MDDSIKDKIESLNQSLGILMINAVKDKDRMEKLERKVFHLELNQDIIHKNMEMILTERVDRLRRKAEKRNGPKQQSIPLGEWLYEQQKAKDLKIAKEDAIKQNMLPDTSS